MKYYEINSSDAPWGDYGNILVNGILELKESGENQIKRIGPYVPPISFPFPGVVVTTELKEKMLSHGFKGLNFLKLKKEKIVNIDYESWDLSKEDPEFIPTTGEPEDYIDERWHNWFISRRMPELWLLEAYKEAKVETIEDEDFNCLSITISLKSTNSYDIVQSNDRLGTFISEKALDFFKQEANNLYTTKELDVKP